MIKLKWLKNDTDTILHFNMCLTGGILGVYALLMRGGNFGSAQTGNLIEAMISALSGDFFDVMLRVGALIIYGGTLVGIFLLSKCFKGNIRQLCIAVEAAGILVTGFIPETVSPIVALYPVFFVTACQWGIFCGARGYNSATIFSTNNIRQMLFGWTEYVRTKDPKQKDKALFYTITLICYHTGVVLGYIAIQFFSVHGVWICFVPLCIALGITLMGSVDTIKNAVRAPKMERSESVCTAQAKINS